MKLILSRKGFDTANGRCPSPIFPDGTMFSLPIPDEQGDGGNSYPTYDTLPHPKPNREEGKHLGGLLQSLTRKTSRTQAVHMSPDLNPPQGWPRLFDQAGAAKGHLKNQGVGEGDLFLFFGLFQEVEDTGERWKFIDDKPQHVLWGWLQVGAKHNCGEGDEELRCSCGNANVRYVARKQLDMGKGIDAPGAGVFPQYDERLLLTDPERDGVTHWRLPKIFHPHPPKTPLTYHGKRVWTLKGDYTHVQRNGPGQEFVLNLDDYDGVKDWALDLIAKFRAK